MNDMQATTVPTVGRQLATLAAEEPDRPALTCEGVTITRGELESSTNRLARAYQELGVRQGDYVTIALPNSIEWAQAAIATWKVGAVLQPLSFTLPDQEFAELLALAPRALLVGRADPSGAIPNIPAGFAPAPELSDAAFPEFVSPVWKAMPSGGSSGRQKLIAVTGDSRLDPAPAAALFGVEPGETLLATGPLTHNTPLVSMVTGLQLGQHVVLMARFDAEQCLRLIAEHRVNWMTTVPTVLQRLLAVYRVHPEAYDLSSLRRLWHMAAPCPPAVKEAWLDILGPEGVWELYAGTELQAVTVVNGTQWLNHRGSVGQVIMGEMKILDEDGNECPPRTTGEIYMRPGEDAPPTYHYIGSDAVSRDGWESIGDMGWFDEDGFLYLSDRRVDMFNVGGRKVYPAEVEGALAGHPAVLSSLVIGIPDDDLGQVPYAVVEADPSAGLDEYAVRSYLKERIAGYKVPRHVEFSTKPLRDLAGKARRSAVRDEVISRLGKSADR